MLYDVFKSYVYTYITLHNITQRAGWGLLLVCGLSDYKCPSQRGSPENVLFPESILKKKSHKRDARRMENPKKSCLNGLVQLCGLA